MLYSPSESPTAMLIGKAIDIILSDFEPEQMEDITESSEPDDYDDDCAQEDDKEVQEFLKIARERRIRKHGFQRGSSDVDNDSLCHIRNTSRPSLCSVASSTIHEDDEEYELPLNDSGDAKNSKDTSVTRASLNDLLRGPF